VPPPRVLGEAEVVDDVKSTRAGRDQGLQLLLVGLEVIGPGVETAGGSRSVDRLDLGAVVIRRDEDLVAVGYAEDAEALPETVTAPGVQSTAGLSEWEGTRSGRGAKESRGR
jgi:hypothetical protein